MRKVFKVNLAILAMIIAIGFVMVSCDDGSGDDGIFNPSNSDSVKVSNYTKTDLVAFRGAITKENLLGGVRAGKTNHALKNAMNLGQNPSQFRMILVTKKDYDRGVNSQTPIFTQLFVFWNGNVGDNSKIYEISDKLGGEYTIQIWNTSNYDVEFRVGGTAGPTLGFAQRGMTQTNLNVGAGDYLVYPIFQRINALRDIVETVVPRYANGNAVGWEVEFGNNKQPISLNLQTALANVASRKLGAASVIIDNQADSGVRFFNGLIAMVTPNGTYSIMGQQEFIIDMPTSAVGGFADQRSISNFKISSMGFETTVKDQDNNTTFTLLTDKMYTITVTGNGPAGTLAATINISTPDDFVIEDSEFTFTN